MRPRASSLLLPAVLPAAVLSIAAQAASPGTLALNSKAAVAITVSVRPQLSLSPAAMQNSGPGAIRTSSASADQICLYTNDTSRVYALLVDRREAQPSADRPNVLAISEAATSACRSRARAGTASATGFRLPRADSGQPYLLLIAAE